MKGDSRSESGVSINYAAVRAVVDRAVFRAELDALRVREKGHTRDDDAIAASRRRLPMVEVDRAARLVGPHGPVTLLDAFEGRRQLIAYYFMWHAGMPAAVQCEGCTLYNGQVRELSFLHSRDATYAALCQGPYEESVRYRDFMGWDMPWYSVQDSAEALLAGRQGNKYYLVCYVRQGERVFETYWTNGRGVEAMDNGNALLDMTVYGCQEAREDSPTAGLRAGAPKAGTPTAPKDVRSLSRPGSPRGAPMTSEAQ
jgi:predicted dithiol-disulfide oxidoreductase (DUF899 family)